MEVTKAVTVVHLVMEVWPLLAVTEVNNSRDTELVTVPRPEDTAATQVLSLEVTELETVVTEPATLARLATRFFTCL